MISPHKHRDRDPDRAPDRAPASPRTAVPLRGLLLENIWRCNCPERPPALKLQTRNHGVNHGRWFYTCQKDHQHRCKFFLWASDAESREKLALLSISRSEGGGVEVTPRTPSPKTAAAQDTGAGTGTGLLTPQTGRRDITTNTHSESRFRKTPAQSHQRRTPQSTKAYMMAEDTEEFEWDDTVESEMEKLVDNSSQPLRQPDFGFGARKTLRTETFTSPGKRKRSDDDAGFDDGRSVTVTPGPEPGAMRSPPFLTPTPTKYKNAAAGVGESPLASSDDTAGQVSSILEGHGVVVPRAAQEELRELFSRHEMKMKGVIRGRDISRVSLRKKDEQIARLEERIVGLEALNRSLGK